MKPKLISFIFLLIVLECHGGSYFISAPRSVIPGTQLDITVDIVQPNVSSVAVEATIVKLSYEQFGRINKQELQSTIGNFTYGSTGTLSLPISPNIDCTDCRLKLRGYDPVQFESELYLNIESQTLSILIQTDKAIYKPRERVHFRILAVYPNLKLHAGTFMLEISDPNGNKINVLRNLKSSTGVVENYFDLSDQPLFGTWTIEVRTETVSGSERHSFQVDDYDLPRFEVVVTLPPFGLLADSLLTGSVQAKYTYGQPVAGLVELQFSDNSYTDDTCYPNRKRVTEISFEMDGKGDFSIPLEDIRRSFYLSHQSVVRVTAFVTETTTGVRLNGSSVVTYYQYKHQLKFLEITPKVFKPGLKYTAYVQATTPDGLPPTDTNLILNVYTLVKYEIVVPDQSFYNTPKFVGSYPLPGQNLSLPADGILAVDVNIPTNATSIDIKVSLDNISVQKSVEKSYSKSNNYLQLFLLDKQVKADSEIKIRITGTEPIHSLTYEVRSRSSTVGYGILNLEGQKELVHTCRVTSAMAPTAQLLMYYVRDSNEIVADSLAFNVEGIFKNTVSVGFREKETDVHKNVTLELSADPESQIYVLAVDQSVLLLKTGNDITPKKVNDAVSNFNKGERPKDDNYALSYSDTSISEIFSNLNLEILTDMDLSPPIKDLYYPGRQFAGMGGYGGGGGSAMNGMRGPPAMQMMQHTTSMDAMAFKQSSPKTEIERIRSIFPETWLWTNILCGNGTAEITTVVPDTITSWVVSAFATHWATGLGVAPTTAMLKVFRPFFVSLTYPRSVTRNEEFVVQATVFNYLSEEQKVNISLENNIFLTPVKSGELFYSIQVIPNKQGVVYFPLTATATGSFDIQVKAISELAGDAVVRQIIVKPEGAPVYFNNPVLIGLSNSNSTFEKNVAFTLPNSTVKDSQRVRVKVTGSLLATSLHSITSLLSLPTGCGEQSLVSFSPNVYIGQYLKASGQMTEELSRKILGLLNEGYQRQLTYKRYDNGFSAFGNYDPSSSTWLTAYVIKAFVEAKEFIFIDPQVVIKAAEWIIQRQNSDGSFTEIGKVLDRNTQGTSQGSALTAFVLIALLKAKEVAINEDCTNVYNCQKDPINIINATEKAIRNLEQQVQADTISDQFSLAVVSYALAEAKSLLSETSLNKLLTFAKKEGELRYWSANQTQTEDKLSRYTFWRPPQVQARPIDILITSYAVLTLTSLEKMMEALPSIRWLISQKNSNGGFVSTQDTVLGLQALSSFGKKTFRPDTNVTVIVSDVTTLFTFNVHKENILSLQIKELQYTGQEFSLLASGIGVALADIEYKFNVLEELSTPSFDVNTVLLDDKLDSFNLMVCTKLLSKQETGMVVQEISIPSGFVPDLSTLGKVAGVKRSERKGDVVAVYFDKITGSSLCYSMVMTRESKVARTQKNFIRTYDYYEPANQATVFYHPRALRDSTIYDVCPQCYP